MDVFDSLTDLLGGGSEGFRRSAGTGILDYLKDVVSGKVAAGGALAQNNYDPNRSFAQNALDPAAIEQATDVAFGVGPGAIRAYHGSPHSFDRFDLSKIGTGEGAQAYGHGLYFAEHEPVARGYRDTLATGHVRAPGREGNLSEDPLLGKAARHLYNANGDYALAAERIRKLAPDAEPALQQLRQMDAAPWPGHMYEVDIHADPKAFLDWDKVLSSQPSVMQQTLVPHVRRAIDTEMTTGTDPLQFTGGEAYGALRGVTPDYSRGGSGLADASAILREAGIPGIRYLDQGSRVTGDPVKLQQQIDFARRFADDTDLLPRDRIGWQQRVAELESDLAHANANPPTSNYAIFDDSIIQILRKYGILPPAVATGGLLAKQSEPPT